MPSTLTSLFSFLLIGYWHHRKDARRGARMALTVTGTGGLAMLAGMLVLGHIVGSYDLDNVLIAGQQVRDHQLYLAALVLILLGALTKLPEEGNLDDVARQHHARHRAHEGQEE